MNFLNLSFYVFMPLFFAIYYITPKSYRYLVLFIGSYFFYGFHNPSIIFALIVITFVAYIGGYLINKKDGSKLIYTIFFFMEISILGIYKYTGFIINNINLLLVKINPILKIHIRNNLLLPVGLSFMVFQACTYLSDIYRGKIGVERNLIRFAAFVSFFPTVLSGPINKARILIPQIKDPSDFDYGQAQKGVLLFTWGLFEKILVADKLKSIFTLISQDFETRTSAENLVAVICFSLYIYADFSSYSDMAQGIAKLLGINTEKNFMNPYLSKTTSEFWRRWHISLNEWFVENVYIPLGGNRRGKLRKYANMLIIFILSGLWHGASWNFVLWGLVNGLLVISGEILFPVRSSLYKMIGFDEKSEYITFIKKIFVFILITFTWVLFSHGVIDSLKVWRKIILFDFISLFDPNILFLGGTVASTYITLLCAVFFCVIQYKRQNEKNIYELYSRQPFLVQCIPVAFMVCICIFAACNTDAIIDKNFLYFQF